jgi:hypothetical protein
VDVLNHAGTDVSALLQAWSEGHVEARDRVMEDLTDLAPFDARKSQVAELKFFGGLTVEDKGSQRGI